MNLRSAFPRLAGLWHGVTSRGVPPRTLVCPAPVPEGNRGDQALLIALVEGLRERGLEPVTLVATSQHPIESYRPGGDIEVISDLHYVFQTDRCLRERLRWVRLLASAETLIVIGADVLDEGYSVERSANTMWAVAQADRMGVRSRIVSFSVNGPPSPGLRKRMTTLGETRLFARDPATFERLTAAGIPNVEQAGDLAFLLKPADRSELPADVRAFFDAHPGRVVGVNLTDVVFGTGTQKDRRFRLLADALAVLAGEGWRFLLVPHDDQGGIEYLAEFHALLRDRVPEACARVEGLPPARQLKAIAGACRHVVTCRLHWGIASLGSGVPITGFPYQGKWEGQFRHLGLPTDGLLPAADLPTDPADLAAFLRNRFERSDELAATLRGRLPTVRALSERNFDGLGTPPATDSDTTDAERAVVAGAA